MELVKYSDYIWEYKNIVPNDVCDEFLKFSPFIFNNIKSTSRNEIRKNDSIDLTLHRSLHPIITHLDDQSHCYISKINQEYINSNPLIAICVNNHGKSVQFLSNYHYRKYNINDEYKWHSDICLNKNFVLSYIIYLNDDYEGGHTMFRNERLKVKGSKGSILCFPVGFEVLHKSSKIKSGEKHIIWSCLDMVEGTPN